MSTGKKISRIAMLMLVSELLIAIFVARWLQSEFNAEKMALQKNLFDQFMSAKSKVMDSVISKNIIRPMFAEDGRKRVKVMHGKSDSAAADSIKIFAINTKIDTVWKPEDSILSLQGENRSSISRQLSFEMNVDSMDDELYRGVKLFISEVAGPEAEAGFFNRHIAISDTALIKEYFARNLNEQKLDVKTIWVKDQPVKQLPPPPFYYESMLFEMPYAARIEGYNGFLIARLLPQLLFALLLLLTTTMAFLLTFRSLRNQLRLAELKDDFISNMSHELRTPLATMKVAVEAMQEMDPVDKKSTLKEYLSMTLQEITRLDVMTNTMMDSILIENSQAVVHGEQVNLQAVINSVLQSFKLNPEHHQLNCRLTAEREEILIDGNSIQVQGIFYNLIDNSLKYGNDKPEITIHISTTKDGIEVLFSDNGPGIPEEYLDKVFDKFFRVPTGDQHNVKGYGLGLHYVAQVMKQVKGSVAVKNRPEGGCQFTLQFRKA